MASKNKLVRALSVAGLLLVGTTAPAQALVAVQVAEASPVFSASPSAAQYSTQGGSATISAPSARNLNNSAYSNVFTEPAVGNVVDYTVTTTSNSADFAPQITAPTAFSNTQSTYQASTPAPFDLSSLDLKNVGELSDFQKDILGTAYSGLGGTYIWGGKTFKAWDCSGYVSWVFKQHGINLTAYTYAMKDELVPTSNPQPGDIVFTNNYAHVGIYVGNGQMISALNPSQGTLVTAVDGGGLMPVDGFYTVKR